jgi:hypothetical protein
MSKRYRNQTLFAVSPALMKLSYEMELKRVAGDCETSGAQRVQDEEHRIEG